MQVRCDVAIVGGGASGALVAAWLLRSSVRPLHIALVDRASAFARGVAYGAPDACHLLNVPAGNLGVDPRQPDGFLRWAQARGLEVKPSDFLPRRLYGEYLAETLAAAEAEGESRGSALFRVPSAVVDVVVRRTHTRIWLESGDYLRAEAAVLATGNLPPANLKIPNDGLYASARYVRSPWQAGALEQLSGDEQVVLLGSGLTAVDVALSLNARGHRGALQMISLQGSLPRTHAPAVAPYRYDDVEVSSGLTARRLLRRVRRAVEEAEARGGSWREALDAIRPHTVTWWRALPVAEQRRFLRHLRQRWEIHRHRMAPEVASVLRTMEHDGRLQLHAGRLRRFERMDDGRYSVVFRPRGGGEERRVEADRVINCTGPCPPAAATDEPIFHSLLIRGLARPDPLKLGFETKDGALVLKNGATSDRLYAIGPLRRGELWETTAMPEIREQARSVALRVLERIGAEPRSNSALAAGPVSS